MKNSKNFNWPVFSKKISQLLEFHSKISRVAIDSSRWEEIIFITLKNMREKYKGDEPRWNSGSHAPGADIWTDRFAISAKSGSIKKRYIAISSYRLTRFRNLKEMINFIDSEAKKIDFYLCCARKNNKDGSRTYTVFKLNSGVLEAASCKWAEMYSKKKKSHSGWTGLHASGIILRIVKKMSNQLWIDMPLDLCEKINEIRISKSELGSLADTPLKN